MQLMAPQKPCSSGSLRCHRPAARRGFPRAPFLFPAHWPIGSRRRRSGANQRAAAARREIRPQPAPRGRPRGPCGLASPGGRARAPPPLINNRGGLLARGGRTMEVPGRATRAEAPWKQLSAEVSGLPGGEVRCACSSGAQAGVDPALSRARGAPACLLRRLQRPDRGCFWPRAGFGDPGFKGRENRSCARIHREGYRSRPDPRVPHADGPPCRWRTERMQKGCGFLTVTLGLETTQAEHTL